MANFGLGGGKNIFYFMPDIGQWLKIKFTRININNKNHCFDENGVLK